MRADRMKRWKAGFMLIVMVMLCIGSEGCGSGSPKDPLQDPTAVTTPGGKVIRYGDTQESVEEILGMETTSWSYDEHHVQYTDETEAFYRETDGKYHMAYIHIRDSSYTTYQGIRVGDNWEEVRERLNPELIRETRFGADLLFDDGKQIDANIDQDKWEEDWIRISYGCYDGDINGIFVLDEKAAEFE